MQNVFGHNNAGNMLTHFHRDTITDGCGATVACGSMITEMVKGRNVSQIQQINQGAVLSALGGLPEGNEHCALLAASTLKEAVKDYLVLKREPWKRAYRKP